MKSHVFKFFCTVVALLGTSLLAAGQTSPPLDQEKGFTEIESFQGSVNSSVKVLELNSTLGYDFNKHFSAFMSAPLYLTSVPNDSTTGTSGSTTVTGVGNTYLGFVYRLPHRQWNFTSTVTGGAPTGSTKKGYSTGRASVDWSNHLERSFGRLTPFIDAGVANTVPNSPFVKRPFTSLGVLGHLEEGTDYELSHRIYIGASAYQILPSGTQKVFSQVVLPDNSAGSAQSQSGDPGQGQSGDPGQGQSGNPGHGQGGNPGHGNGHGNGQGQGHNGNGANGSAADGNAGQGNPNRPFETAFITTGTGLTRENGFDSWVTFEPNQFWEVQTGFSRSMTYQFNSFTFNVALNVGKFFRSRKGH